MLQMKLQYRFKDILPIYNSDKYNLCRKTIFRDSALMRNQ